MNVDYNKIFDKMKKIINLRESGKVTTRDLVQDYVVEMGYDVCKKADYWNDGDEYTVIENSLYIRYYDGRTSAEEAINLLTEACEIRDYEWGILFYSQMIVLINSDISKGDTVYKANKVVFRFNFSRPQDKQYFKYLSYDNLLKNKKTCFFRDIIQFRNVGYDKSQKSWPQYLSATRRFFDYYCRNINEYKEDIYDHITGTDLETSLRNTGTTRTQNYIKNQYYYINAFLKWKSPKNLFAEQGATKIVKNFGDITDNYCPEEIDFKTDELKHLFDRMQADPHAQRMQVLILLMFSFGMDRKQLCKLQWNSDLKLDRVECSKIRINQIWFRMPSVLAEKLIDIDKNRASVEKYVIGSRLTKYEKPLPEDGINTILASISKYHCAEEKYLHYKYITVANVRRWLFKRLLNEHFSLGAVMNMLNISPENLRTYINSEQLRHIYLGDTRGIDVNMVHPMEEFINGIFS